VDTRTKILDCAEAEKLFRRCMEGRSPLKVVTGYFDPLLAGHARRLREITGPGAQLAVVLATPENPLLPARARAELVAALAVVDYVVLPPEGGADRLLEQLPAQSVFHEEVADAGCAEEFIRRVHRRQARA